MESFIQSSNFEVVSLEEPEYLALQVLVLGFYKWILCISIASIITLDPLTLVVTNTYEVLVIFRVQLRLLVTMIVQLRLLVMNSW